ncbi:uncharacterized protein L201_000159 [Kwoniella dendrophila CBS 6074]|uniref:Protein CPL1-like domain-containing protein n=1 Tax=Kwoniella dendrophila CBS 6074 TaxID=1295534 RepID=A0AAX4JIL5_9TREE
MLQLYNQPGPYSESALFQTEGESPFLRCRSIPRSLDPAYLIADRFCDYPNINVTIIDPPTKWTWAGCWYLQETPLWFQVQSVSSCLESCKSSLYAYSRYNQDLTIDCLCSPSQPPFDLPLNCGYGDPFWYTHPDLPSGFVKRQQQKARLDKEGQLSLGLCPEGSKACKVPGTNGIDFECIDTDSELESCGGCVHGEFSAGNDIYEPQGIDCTSLPGITSGGVSCDQGLCKASACEDRFELVDGICVKNYNEV